MDFLECADGCNIGVMVIIFVLLLAADDPSCNNNGAQLPAGNQEAPAVIEAVAK